MSSNLEKEKLDNNRYILESASDGSLPEYEEAAVTTGAPTEKISPLGYQVDWISVVFLVRGQSLPEADFSLMSVLPAEYQ